MKFKDKDLYWNYVTETKIIKLNLEWLENL